MASNFAILFIAAYAYQTRVNDLFCYKLFSAHTRPVRACR